MLGRVPGELPPRGEELHQDGDEGTAAAGGGVKREAEVAEEEVEDEVDTGLAAKDAATAACCCARRVSTARPGLGDFGPRTRVGPGSQETGERRGDDDNENENENEKTT